MEITEVRISPSRGGKVRAFASIVLDDCFIVNDLRVMEGREGQLYITMPARKIRNGQMRDIAHPLNGDTRMFIEEKVLEEYTRAVEHHAVPNPDTAGTDQPENSGSFLDRLAARLFSEEFWTSDVPPHRE